MIGVIGEEEEEEDAEAVDHGNALQEEDDGDEEKWEEVDHFGPELLPVHAPPSEQSAISPISPLPDLDEHLNEPYEDSQHSRASVGSIPLTHEALAKKDAEDELSLSMGVESGVAVKE
jgi:hypothetical protein